jgi:hypothetical protein
MLCTCLHVSWVLWNWKEVQVSPHCDLRSLMLRGLTTFNESKSHRSPSLSLIIVSSHHIDSFITRIYIPCLLVFLVHWDISASSLISSLTTIQTEDHEEACEPTAFVSVPCVCVLNINFQTIVGVWERSDSCAWTARPHGLYSFTHELEVQEDAAVLLEATVDCAWHTTTVCNVRNLVGLVCDPWYPNSDNIGCL